MEEINKIRDSIKDNDIPNILKQDIDSGFNDIKIKELELNYDENIKDITNQEKLLQERKNKLEEDKKNLVISKEDIKVLIDLDTNIEYNKTKLNLAIKNKDLYTIRKYILGYIETDDNIEYDFENSLSSVTKSTYNTFNELNCICFISYYKFDRINLNNIPDYCRNYHFDHLNNINIFDFREYIIFSNDLILPKIKLIESINQKNYDNIVLWLKQYFQHYYSVGELLDKYSFDSFVKFDYVKELSFKAANALLDICYQHFESIENERLAKLKEEEAIQAKLEEERLAKIRADELLAKLEEERLEKIKKEEEEERLKKIKLEKFEMCKQLQERYYRLEEEKNKQLRVYAKKLQIEHEEQRKMLEGLIPNYEELLKNRINSRMSNSS